MRGNPAHETRLRYVAPELDGSFYTENFRLDAPDRVLGVESARRQIASSQ